MKKIIILILVLIVALTCDQRNPIDPGTIDCNGELDGNAIEDECGECGGDGIDEGECDCAGNVNDCAGECAGTAC